MPKRRIHLECLLGRRVYDRDNKYAGRLEEVRAELRDGQCFVIEYLLGREALLARLSIEGVARSFTRLLGGRKNTATHKVPWDRMDLADPNRLRLTCLAEEVEAIEP
jgi:hypothetical protein